MKTFPICHAGAFDDAQICYGCLYRFSDEDPAITTARMPAASATTGSNGPALLISVQAVPRSEGGVEWRCDVDGRSLAVPTPL